MQLSQRFFEVLSRSPRNRVGRAFSPGSALLGGAVFLALGSTALAQEESSEGSTAAAPRSTVSLGTSGESQTYQGASTSSSASSDTLNSYLPSSSQPRIDGTADGFDLNRSSSGSMVLQGGEGNDGTYGSYGEADGSVNLGKPRGAVPEFHVVKKGDTLWDISQTYFANPWEWPRVWSLNPQVENPHWIYPGDQLRTARVSGATPQGLRDDNSAGGGGFVGRQRIVPSGTIFLRDQGYIGDPERDVWGELVGGREEKMMLSDQDTVYLLMKEGVDLRLGQRLTIFREVRGVDSVDGARTPPGELVKVYGTVRIDAWDRDTRVAKGKLIESLDVIERGSQVGPVGRRFDVVPPKRSTVEVEARVLTSVYPHIYFGQNQVVFIDKGSEDGLVSGNRLRVVRRGDTWRNELRTSSVHARLRVPVDSPEEAPSETTPLHGDDESFPDEVVAEVMILRTEQYSSVCLVTEANRPLVVGDRMLSTAGY